MKKSTTTLPSWMYPPGLFSLIKDSKKEHHSSVKSLKLWHFMKSYLIAVQEDLLQWILLAVNQGAEREPATRIKIDAGKGPGLKAELRCGALLVHCHVLLDKECHCIHLGISYLKAAIWIEKEALHISSEVSFPCSQHLALTQQRLFGAKTC